MFEYYSWGVSMNSFVCTTYLFSSKYQIYFIYTVLVSFQLTKASTADRDDSLSEL